MAILKVNTNADLNAQPGNLLDTDAYGVAKASVEFQYDSADEAEQARPQQGAPCPLTDYPSVALFAHTSSSRRMVGDTSVIQVEYYGIDPKVAIVPESDSDLELRDTGATLDTTVDGKTLTSGAVPGITFIPIPHAVLNYRFAANKAQNALGTYGTPPSAPSPKPYTWVNSYNYLGKAVSVTFTFVPDPKGWLCLKDKSTPMCGGKIFLIDQQWKRYLIYSATVISPASVFTGS